MSSKPRVFVLDAGPVIRLHELGLWEALLERAEVILPAIVVDESRYWVAPEGRRTIGLDEPIAKGQLRVIAADANEVEEVRARFDASISESVHAGELEALTLLGRWPDSPPYFCCADQLATIAACLLGFADRVISFEALLARIGLGRTVSPPWFTEQAMAAWFAEGRRRRVTGEGLRPGDRR